MVDLLNIMTNLGVLVGGKALGFFTGKASDIVAGNSSLGGMLGISTIFLIMIFILFIFIIKKAIGMITTIAMIGVASALFPVILNYIGFSIPINMETIIFFVVIGLAAYFLFMIGKIVLGLLGGSGSEKKEKA
ncbi:MAG: hypothetical protein V1870_04930 [Candidatus Aenigmatarchaeota archaeon]